MCEGLIGELCMIQRPLSYTNRPSRWLNPTQQTLLTGGAHKGQQHMPLGGKSPVVRNIYISTGFAEGAEAKRGML